MCVLLQISLVVLLACSMVYIKLLKNYVAKLKIEIAFCKAFLMEGNCDKIKLPQDKFYGEI